MLATDLETSGSAEEKLRWVFEMYDEDRSGERWLLPSSHSALPMLSGAIGMTELLEILDTLHDMEGANKENITKMANGDYL